MIMPWCPKCKTEYREGVTHCADCKTELVADYKEVLLQNATVVLAKVDAEHRVFTEKLHDFLEYSGISSVVLSEGEMLGVYVAPEDLKKAKKCFKAFYSVETEMVMQQAEEAAFLKGEEYDNYFGDEEADEPEEEENGACPQCQDKTMSHSRKASEKNFVSAASRYEDYRSSGFTFTILGGFGIGFAFLNFVGVISLFGSVFSSSVLFIMFSIFLGLGIFSFVKAGKLKEDAKNEQEQIATVKAWLQENITDEVLASLRADGSYEDEPKTAELLYLDYLDQLLDKVLVAFPAINASLAEQLIEEFCNQNLE
ncbi:MAG: hypothetical protein PUC73_02545 [Lachnospiraceae bacterium]|nr:hypothetical protein [Lachnospiraceae bacterium]